MRKMVKPEVKCKQCKATIKQQETAVFCDYCNKLIGLERYYLDITVFKVNDETEHVEFCSWKCVFAWLKKNKSKMKNWNFISLPYIICEQSTDKKKYVDVYHGFFKALTET